MEVGTSGEDGTKAACAAVEADSTEGIIPGIMVLYVETNKFKTKWQEGIRGNSQATTTHKKGREVQTENKRAGDEKSNRLEKETEKEREREKKSEKLMVGIWPSRPASDLYLLILLMWGHNLAHGVGTKWRMVVTI